MAMMNEAAIPAVHSLMEAHLKTIRNAEIQLACIVNSETVYGNAPENRGKAVEEFTKTIKHSQKQYDSLQAKLFRLIEYCTKIEP